MANLLIYSTIICLIQVSTGYRILGVFPHPGKSHFDVYLPLLINLAEKGHEVTVISHFPLEKPMRNYRDISLRGSMTIWHTIFAFDDFTFYEPTKKIMLHYVTSLLLTDFGNQACKALVTKDEVKQLKEGQFDVAIVEMFNTDCGLGLVHNLKVPYIGLTSHVLMSWTFGRFGLIENPSIVATIHLGHGDRPNIFQTAENLLVNTYYKWAYYFLSQRVDSQILDKHYVKGLPPLEEIARKTSLLLLNTYPVFHGVHLYPPSTIEIGGIHLHNRTSKMEPHIQEFLDASHEGVIVFSMGSMLKAITWPEEKLKVFKKAFSEIPQIVLWKWENDTIEGVSKNVKTMKWIPQFDVLKHENVKGFITHAGNLGTTEAVYCGVPLISIPMYGDQYHNAESSRRSGLGVIVQFNNITIESMRWALKEITSPRMQSRAKRVSSLWHDRPLSPMDTATYWVEHIAQHGDGDHLRPPSVDVPWYRYLLLDVLALIFGSLFVMIYVIYRISKFLYRLVVGKPIYKFKKH